MKNIVIFFSSILLLNGCKPKDATTAGTPFTYNKPGGAPVLPTTASAIVFTSPSSSPNFDSTPTVTLTGVVGGETVKLYGNSNCSTELGSAVASSTSVQITSQTLDVGAQNFYTKSFNSVGASDCSSALATYTYLGTAPTIATSMTLQSPAASPATDSTPTFSMAGVVSGETIKIYTNSSCTSEVGSAVAQASTVLVSASALAPGTYIFYTKSTNGNGSSNCSTAMASYEYLGVLPNSGSSITLNSPTSSPNYDSTPTVTVNGVSNGDTVKLFTDAGCSIQVGSALATGSSVQITSSTLAVATHSFYTNSSNLIGTSACSSALVSYNYLGASPTVEVSWSANKEKAVNSSGGGYRVYYSTTSGFDPASASYVNVPYVSGATAPTSTTISNFMAGTYYFKVKAYSSLNPPGQSGGSLSEASAQFQLTLP